MAERAETPQEAQKILKQKITDGSALHKFTEFVMAQGGDPSWIEHPENFCRADYIEEILFRPPEEKSETYLPDSASHAAVFPGNELPAESGLPAASPAKKELS